MTYQVASELSLVVLVTFINNVYPNVISDVHCASLIDSDRQDPNWSYKNWKAGSQHWHVAGSNDTKICDIFVESYRDSGLDVLYDAVVCRLTTTNIDIGAAWIDTAGSTQYPGTVYVMVQQKNQYRWVSRSVVKGHGHKMRIQFYGKPTNKQKPSAMLLCGNAEVDDKNKLNTDHNYACHFKSYSA